jgi:hypothetical protein
MIPKSGGPIQVTRFLAQPIPSHLFFVADYNSK